MRFIICFLSIMLTSLYSNGHLIPRDFSTNPTTENSEQTLETILSYKFMQKILFKLGEENVGTYRNNTLVEDMRNNMPSTLKQRITDYVPTTVDVTNPVKEDKEILMTATNVTSCIPEHSSACFSFTISLQSFSQNIRNAILWLEVDNYIFHNKQLTLSHIAYKQNKQVEIRRNIATTITPQKADSNLLGFDMNSFLKIWFNNTMTSASYNGTTNSTDTIDISHLHLAVVCDDCSFFGVSPVNVERVLLEIQVKETNEAEKPAQFINKRSKRSTATKPVYCHEGVIECCVEKYRLDFQKVGWSDWIVNPPYIDINYCRGHCKGETVPTSVHASLMQNVVMKFNESHMDPDLVKEMTPCCAPTKMSSTMVLYLTNQGTYELRQLNNIVALECGCF